jgi:hypothetical protein
MGFVAFLRTAEKRINYEKKKVGSFDTFPLCSFPLLELS